MKRVLATLLLLITFLPLQLVASEWNPIAAKVAKSIAYLTGPQGNCTAFVIDSKRDYVLTAAHCDQRTSSGESSSLVDNIPTKVISKDVKKDLLVLEVKGIDKPALRLAKSDPEVGDEVASYGYGHALSKPLFRVTHISAIDTEETPDMILTDADFVQGQSGAPVVDTNGDVVMIVNAGDGTKVGVGYGAETIKSRMGRYFEKAAP